MMYHSKIIYVSSSSRAGLFLIFYCNPLCRSRIATFSDFNKGGGDDDEDEDGQNEYYAGGEKRLSHLCGAV